MSLHNDNAFLDIQFVWFTFRKSRSKWHMYIYNRHSTKKEWGFLTHGSLKAATESAQQVFIGAWLQCKNTRSVDHS